MSFNHTELSIKSLFWLLLTISDYLVLVRHPLLDTADLQQFQSYGTLSSADRVQDKGYNGENVHLGILLRYSI